MVFVSLYIRCGQAANNRQELRTELGTAQDATVALFVGSGFRIKGLDRALRAIRVNQSTAPQLEFWVVGKLVKLNWRSDAGLLLHLIGEVKSWVEEVSSSSTC